ncbi:hypothetical protein SLEP1_g47863 [Rubroshorea leprosula]|uniref:AAA+ ATPase domain-containing protein n=1 Tax=Rubroshorea leprosula TaxID=152421 RepID=A0AAV5LRV7_9ROSI|nr:hypothetical protein SLEP1_g47863 [Rubroshorea leprosula]
MQKLASELKEDRDILQHSIDQAARLGEMIRPAVNRWMNGTERLISEMKALHDRNLATKRYCFGWCPNLQHRYRFSKAAVEHIEHAHILIDKYRGYGVISRPSVPVTVQKRDVDLLRRIQELAEAANFGGYENFNSRRSVLTDIMEAFLSPGINSIGVHGAAGVGKTMLVEQIKAKAEEMKLFDVVVMAKVTENPDLKTIQDEIALDLGIELHNRVTREEAADRIKSRLTNRKVLVILDDIWERIDLEKVGIPYGNKQKLKQLPGEKNEEMSSEYTVLLTSRNPRVLSHDGGMHTQIIVKVPMLEDGEAWKLFRKTVSLGNIYKKMKKAGEKAGNQFLPIIAKEISKRCGGLPIGIATLADTLKDKDPQKWRITLLRLQKNPNLSGMSPSLYSAIELRYSDLKSKELKQTLLLCSLMGHNAGLQDLLKYGIGLGLFPRAKSMEKARDEALKLVNELIRDYSLLLVGGSNMQFDMHEPIRGVAISIASGDHGVLSFRKDAAKDSLNEKAFKKSKWIYLSNVDASELPAELKCPLLTFFHFSANNDRQAIPSYLFRGAEGLRVLGLTKVHFKSIPPSISLLINLHTLCLDQSEFDENSYIGSIIGELKNLQVLSLARCDIQVLPEDIGKLIRLKFLDLSDCTKLTVIPRDVLSKLTQLEELYLGNSFDQWQSDNKTNASLDELGQLENLTALEVRIHDIKMIPVGLFSVELERYKIFIGDVWNYWVDSSFENSKMLKLKLDGSTSFDYSVRKLLNKAEELHLEMLNGVKNVVNELDDHGFQELKHLHVKNDPKIQHMFFNSVMRIRSKVFPNLEVLFLHKLMTMEKIFYGQFEQTSLKKLRIISVECCGKLKNLFSFSIAKQLLHLQEIRVTDCSEIVEIFYDEGQGDEEEEEDTDDITEATDVIKLAHLKCLRLQHLPKFISFSQEKDANISFFNEKLEVPELQELQLSWINIKTIWPPGLSPIPASQWKLTKLIIEGCNNLEYIFSSSIIRCLKKLKHLEVRECKMLREIIVTGNEKDAQPKDTENAEDADSEDTEYAEYTYSEDTEYTKYTYSEDTENAEEKISFRDLNFLQIENLQNLIGFYSGNYRIKFPSLKQLAIENCPELKGFVVDSTSTTDTALFDEKVAFPNLERMTISLLKNLKILWRKFPKKENSFERLNFLSIEDLQNLIALCSEDYCTEFSYLKQLTIEKCPKLNGFVKSESMSEALFDEKIAFPKLERLSISHFNNSMMIWKKLGENSFCNLKSLRVTYCQNLSFIFPSNNDLLRKLLKSLEKLEIIGCSSVEEVFELGQQSEITASDAQITESDAENYQFKELYIDQLPRLKHVWNKDLQEIDTFQNLESVTVSRCESLNHLFPFSLAKSLFKLKRLKIQSCTSLEEIVARKSAVKEEVNFEFDSLSCLILHSLPGLRCFYPGKHKKSWPALEKFYSYHCGETEITNKPDQAESAVELPLFSLEKDLPKLKKLSLTDENIRSIISEDQRSTAGPFNNIVVLRIQGYCDESTVRSINFIQKFPHLEKLVVDSCDFEKLFPSNSIGKHSSIRKLKLQGLPNSRHIWSQDSSVPQNLETLKVWRCTSLVGLSISTASFPTLTTFDVWRCHKVINLVSLSTAQSLVKLKSLSIRECQEVIEIVEKDKPATNEEINFKELRYLRLECLTRLSSFCSGNFIFKFPSLERVIVDQCPNLKIFCQGNHPAAEPSKDGTIGKNAQGANGINEGMEKENCQEKEGNEDNGLGVRFELDDLDPSVAQDAEEQSVKE